jgi:hypothetical protein
MAKKYPFSLLIFRVGLPQINLRETQNRVCCINLKRTFMIVILLICLTVLTTGCVGNETIKVGYEPPKRRISLLTTANSLRIKLLEFEDKRASQIDSVLIGNRQAAFGVPMGALYSDLPVFEIIRSAVMTELTRSGHIIVDENEDIAIKGEIRAYWVSTETTVLYWDVIGEVGIIIEVKQGDNESFIKLGPYNGRSVERTYLNPSVAIMKRVLGASLETVMHKLSSDTELVRIFKNH